MNFLYIKRSDTHRSKSDKTPKNWLLEETVGMITETQTGKKMQILSILN